MKTKIYTKKFHKVAYRSADGKKFNELFIGETPAESLENAKKSKIGYSGFKVGKTAYNTLGEKYDN